MSKLIRKYYVIEHIPSSQFIPQAQGFKGRGGSHVEPGEGHPKLFKSEKAAKSWLTTWLKGKQTRNTYQGYDGDYYETVETTPVLSRKREEMRIVLVQLSRVDS